MNAGMRYARIVGLVAAAGVGVACGGRVEVGSADSADGATPRTDYGDAQAPVTINKVDLLFVVQNSAPMYDLDGILAQAVPSLVGRLVDPNCVDATGKVLGASAGGSCAAFAGSELEFPPVHDLHIGVVSSSLGGRGSDQCPEYPDTANPSAAENPTNPALDRHDDDHGHLLDRADPMNQPMNQEVESPIPDEGTGSFLAWLPSKDPGNAGQPSPPDGVVAIQDAAQLTTDFQGLVSGVHAFGCAWAGPLESFYRFLVQPDPYQSVAFANGRVSYVGIDSVLLKQRHDFLRPDSLLAVITVAAKNETLMDPIALGGQGWAYMNSVFPGSTSGGAPKATAICAEAPLDPGCNSCAFAPSDPSCTSVYYTVAQDNLSLRAFNMKQRFGVDVLYPVARSVRGLAKLVVPDQGGEHFNGDPEYTGEDHADWDMTDMNADPAAHGCTNPIFAESLPTDSSGELCHLARGPRQPTMVYYAIVGGVPHQLLQVDPTNPDSPQKDTFTDYVAGSDWWKMIGKDPLGYDFTGVDPHMLESATPRAGIATYVPGSTTNDPINGGDFDNGLSALQYACVFPLPTPIDCADPAVTEGCECQGDYAGPLCQNPGPYGPGNSLQTKAFAYPTIRELAVARAMGGLGIVSSLCPIHTTDNATQDDPLYGYRPAVTTIVNRLGTALAVQK